MQPVKKIFNYYLTISSSLMLLYVIISLIQMISNGNFITHQRMEHYTWFSRFLGYTFMFCLYNIVVCAIAGLYLLFKKETRRLALFCLVASGAFFLIVREIGDAF